MLRVMGITVGCDDDGTLTIMCLLSEWYIVFKRPEILGLNRTLSLVALLNGTELGNGCDPIEDDLKGKTVLVYRGGCLFSTKVPFFIHFYMYLFIYFAKMRINSDRLS